MRRAPVLLAVLGLLAGAGPAGAAAAGGGTVAEVGDSLGVGTLPQIRARLPGVSIRGDVLVGRPSIDGPPILQKLLRPSDTAVVFDLGTNDDPANPGALTRDLRDAAALAGGRCMIVATLNRPPLNGVGVGGLNAAITAFAARRPDTIVIPWHRYAAASPGLLGPDHIHPTGTGYRFRGRLFAQAIERCRTGASPSLPPVPKVEPRAHEQRPGEHADAPRRGPPRRRRGRRRERSRGAGTAAPSASSRSGRSRPTARSARG